MCWKVVKSFEIRRKTVGVMKSGREYCNAAECVGKECKDVEECEMWKLLESLGLWCNA